MNPELAHMTWVARQLSLGSCVSSFRLLELQAGYHRIARAPGFYLGSRDAILVLSLPACTKNTVYTKPSSHPFPWIFVENFVQYSMYVLHNFVKNQ